MLTSLSQLSTLPLSLFLLFFFNDTATTEIYTLSLHDALPISCPSRCTHGRGPASRRRRRSRWGRECRFRRPVCEPGRDRKSTRLNSSHANISYAVFCLKKKKKYKHIKNPENRTTRSLVTSLVT